MLLNECLLNNVSVVLFIYIITDVSRDDVMRVSRADVKRSLWSQEVIYIELEDVSLRAFKCRALRPARQTPQQNKLYINFIAL